jgi:putative transposase
MKRKRFKAEQIVGILKEAEREGATVADVCRAHGVSEQTFYRWKKTYSGMQVAEVRRLRQLEDENARLKKLVAERDLEIDAIKELLRKNF